MKAININSISEVIISIAYATTRKQQSPVHIHVPGDSLVNCITNDADHPLFVHKCSRITSASTDGLTDVQ